MIEQDLETLYSPSCFSKRYGKTEVLQKHIQFIEAHSKLVKSSIPCDLGISYGPGLKEKYDIYGTDLREDAPIVIHIHGGYYHEESITHANNSFISQILYRNGIKTILLGYELSPQRTVPEILEHLQMGIRECLKYARNLKCKATFLSGHSVGAHAIATILPDFKRSISQTDSNLIKGAFLLCGIYNLEPLTQMSVNDLLNLTIETAKEELSPMLFDKADYGGTEIYIVAAENDSPAFVVQSQQFFKKLKSEEADVHFNLIPVVDHFDCIENLFYEDYELSRLLVTAIKKYV
ncbi:hypothetical protein ABEB36_004148 [Hypothenemus hampei]|uniref:Alpha/beta hydrolase fold-3 domain-containing protein n=1 Tax=Hypothenemus hampei TaxID=57062 RepID=A0ABD1F637_HYPHA